MAETPKLSPVNIEQNRAVGQDSPTEGSRIGREANKKKGYPGTPDIGTNAGQTRETKDEPAPPSQKK